MTRRVRRPPPVGAEVEWWRRRIVKAGSVVAALAVMVGAGSAAVTWFDGKYALAGDVQQIQADVLELRRDGLVAERRELQRAQRQRRLTDPELDRLEKLGDLIRTIDRRLDVLRKKGDTR